MLTSKSEEMEAWEGEISPGSPLLGAKSSPLCPLALPDLLVLPAKTCALEHRGGELLQEGSQACSQE